MRIKDIAVELRCAGSALLEDGSDGVLKAALALGVLALFLFVVVGTISATTLLAWRYHTGVQNNREAECPFVAAAYTSGRVSLEIWLQSNCTAGHLRRAIQERGMRDGN